MSELVGQNQGLKPIELAEIRRDFNWQTEAWFNGQLHPITRLTDQTEWVSKKDFIYQITPFVFQDEAAGEAQGSHFIISESRYTNTILFTESNYRWRLRIVAGAGWLQTKDPAGNLFEEWLGEHISANKVYELTKGWMSRLTAAIGYGPMIMEAVDLPRYQEDWEQIIPAGDKQTFWLP